MGHYPGQVGVGGDEWDWVHCLIMPIKSRYGPKIDLCGKHLSIIS